MDEEQNNAQQMLPEEEESIAFSTDEPISENEQSEEGDSAVQRVLLAIAGFFQFIGRTTVQFFKQLPHMISTKYKAKVAEYRRMPKRRSINKVYVLVGYTTKEYVDRKYRKERALLITRKILVACIVFVILLMTWRWFYPKLDTEEYKQMIGIEKMNDLTQEDPFAVESTTVAIAPESQEVTPIPTNTVQEQTTTQPIV